MSTEQARYNLDSLKKRFLFLRITEIVLISIGVAMLVFTLSGFFIVSATTKIILAIFSGVLMLGLQIWQQGLHRFSNQHLVHLVNWRYAELQESADLLLAPDAGLTALQRLQKEKTLERFELLYPRIRFPHRIGQALGIFAAGAVVYVALSGFAITEEKGKKTRPTPIQKQIKAADADPAAVFIKSLTIRVTPPAYTGIAALTSESFALHVPEGSSVNWLATFSGPTDDSKIIFSGRDSVRMRKHSELSYGIDQTINTSGFYQVQWRDRGSVYRSDYFKIDMVKDQPPKISVSNLSQFTQLRLTDKLIIDVKSTLSDDYGLRDAQIIATVSKGSGEGVKFREEKIRFASPQRISGKQVTAEASLNLRKLGLEPGDELYFYVEATDTKTPVANRNRTETFFIALKDTASYAQVSDEGLGVDLMPEYFRSQRQIIIDTEKLLKQQKQKQVTKQQFNFTSNELGYDQKVLRLRYGQFLGEEEDSGIPHGTEPEEEHTDEEEEGKEKDPTKEFAHEHDTKNEHNLVQDKKIELHNHNATTPGEEEEKDPLKAFVHEHDNQEEATFFIVSIKTKLKMALSVMWDAELHLRLYDPAKSLPYQYKALNLLKEISNDSRIYVHRMGFDPPPLKEEKRLTADLSEVKTSTNRYQVEAGNNLEGIQKTLSIIETLVLQEKPVISDSFKKMLNQAGEELAALAIAEPGASLTSLSLIRKLLDENITSEKLQVSLRALQKELWNILPPQPASAQKQPGNAHALDRQFMQQLDGLKHD